MLRPGRWRYRDTVLVLCVGSYFGIRLVEFVLSIVFEDIKAALGISTFVLGLAVAVSTVTYAAAQLPSGALGDRFGERRVILTSLVLTALAGLLVTGAPSGLFIVLGMGIIGLVGGAYYSPATAFLGDLFEETGSAIGVHRIGAQLVGISGPIVGIVAGVYGWRSPLLIAAGFAGLVVVGWLLFGRHRPPVDPSTAVRDRLALDSLRGLFARPAIRTTTVVAAAAQFADTATFSFLPLLLREYHGLSVGLAGTLFTVYFVGVTIGQPIAGRLADRIGRDPVIVGTLMIGSVGYVGLGVQTRLVTIGTAVLLIGLGMGWGPPVQARLLDYLDDHERGTGFGLVRSVYIGLAALNGIVVGWVVTRMSWRAGIAVLLGAFLVAMLVLLYGIRRHAMEPAGV